MKNFVQKGDALTVTIPADVASGVGVQVGAGLFGVAANAYLAGEEGVICTEGVYDLAKAAEVVAAGDLIYWDNTAKVVTVTATGNLLIGVAAADALVGDKSASVLI